MTIRELIAYTGLSQRAFAARFEIPHRTVQNWCEGVNKCPSYLLKLLEYRIKNEEVPK